MTFKSWWGEKSRKSKAITVVSTLLILQIGLCFGTPSGVSWFQAILHIKPGDDPFENLGYMFVEGILCLVTGLVLFVIGVSWHPDPNASQRNEDLHDR